MRIIETMSATQTERSALVTKQVELLTKLFNLSKEKELLNTTLQELHTKVTALNTKLQELHTKVTALNTKLEVHLKAASNLDRRSLGKNNVAKINAEQTNKILSIYNEKERIEEEEEPIEEEKKRIEKEEEPIEEEKKRIEEEEKLIKIAYSKIGSKVFALDYPGHTFGDHKSGGRRKSHRKHNKYHKRRATRRQR